MVVYASSHNEGLVVETESEQETKLLHSVLEFISRYNDIHNDNRLLESEVEFAGKLAEELRTYLEYHEEEFEISND